MKAGKDQMLKAEPSVFSLRVLYFQLQLRKLGLKLRRVGVHLLKLGIQLRILRLYLRVGFRLLLNLLLKTYHVLRYHFHVARYRFHVLKYEKDLVAELGRDWRTRIRNDQIVQARKSLDQERDHRPSVEQPGEESATEKGARD